MPQSSSSAVARRGGSHGPTTAATASNAPLPPTMSYYNFSLALVEVLFALMEFLFTLVITKETLTSLYTALHPHQPDPPPYNAALIHLLSNAATLLVVAARLAQRLHVPLSSLPARLGLTQPRLTAMTGAVLLLHTVGFAGMCASQWWFGQRLFSWRNYFTKDGTELEPAMIGDMLLLAPLREELVFRAAIFCVFYLRLGDDTAVSKLLCCGLSGLVFGLVHLMNLLGTRYSPLYIALQVGLGVLLGNFYAMRFVLSESLLQSVIMHAVNNLYSSFVPLDVELDLTNPLIAVPLLQTLVVYSVLTVLSARQLLESGVKPFGPLIHTPSTSELNGPAEQTDAVVNGQAAEQSDKATAGDERKEATANKPERRKKR